MLRAGQLSEDFGQVWSDGLTEEGQTYQGQGIDLFYKCSLTTIY